MRRRATQMLLSCTVLAATHGCAESEYTATGDTVVPVAPAPNPDAERLGVTLQAALSGFDDGFSMRRTTGPGRPRFVGTGHGDDSTLALTVDGESAVVGVTLMGVVTADRGRSLERFLARADQLIHNLDPAWAQSTTWLVQSTRELARSRQAGERTVRRAGRVYKLALIGKTGIMALEVGPVSASAP